MPIDPRIPLMGAPAAAPVNPMQMITQVLQGQRVASELRGLRQSEADQAAIRQVLQETGGDIQVALPRLRMIAPGATLELEGKLAEGRKHAVETTLKQYELRSKAYDTGIKVVQTIVDEPSFQVAKRMLATLSPEVDQALGEAYDPAGVESLLRAGLSAKELADQQRDALKLLTEGKATEAVGTYLGTARNQEEWNQTLAAAGRMGVPSEILEAFGTEFSPEAVARAKSIAIGPTKEAELAGQLATRTETARHNAAVEATSAGQLAVAQQNARTALGRLAVARQRLEKGTGSEQDRDALVDAVLDNPGLFDQITPTERGKIAPELQRRGFTGFGKPLSDGAVAKISESKSAIASLKDLREVLQANEQYIGPLAGFQALNPYSEARKAQADIDRVRQRVGKALEGGVLRKEDEEKYKKILATLRDEPSTAIYKVDQLVEDIERDIAIYTHEQRLQGRRVPQADGEGRPGGGVEVKAPNGKTYRFNTPEEAAAFKKRAGIP